MIEAYDLTDTSVTFIAEDGVPRSVEVSHPNYNRVRAGVLDGVSADDLIALVDPRIAIEGVKSHPTVTPFSRPITTPL